MFVYYKAEGIGPMRSAIGDVGAVVTGLTLGGGGRRQPPPLLNKSKSSMSMVTTTTTGSSSSSLLHQNAGGSSTSIVSGEAYPLVMDTKLKIIEILQVCLTSISILQ